MFKIFQWPGERRGWYPATQHPSVALVLQSGEKTPASDQPQHQPEETGDTGPEVPQILKS